MREKEGKVSERSDKAKQEDEEDDEEEAESCKLKHMWREAVSDLLQGGGDDAEVQRTFCFPGAGRWEGRD